MKILLGKTVNSFQFYKMDFSIPGKKRIETRGYIWLADNLKIRIEGSKFFIINNLKKNGFISKSSITYKKIKRMIAGWFKNYRLSGTFNHGNDYWKTSVSISLNKFKIQRLEKFQKQII